MPRFVLRTVALFTLACAIAIPIASAAPAWGERRLVDDSVGIATFSRVLSELWTSLNRFLVKTGSSLDPSGNPRPAGASEPPASTDEGSSLDPSG